MVVVPVLAVERTTNEMRAHAVFLPVRIFLAIRDSPLQQARKGS